MPYKIICNTISIAMWQTRQERTHGTGRTFPKLCTTEVLNALFRTKRCDNPAVRGGPTPRFFGHFSAVFRWNIRDAIADVGGGSVSLVACACAAPLSQSASVWRSVRSSCAVRLSRSRLSPVSLKLNLNATEVPPACSLSRRARRRRPGPRSHGRNDDAEGSPDHAAN